MLVYRSPPRQTRQAGLFLLQAGVRPPSSLAFQTVFQWPELPGTQLKLRWRVKPYTFATEKDRNCLSLMVKLVAYGCNARHCCFRSIILEATAQCWLLGQRNKKA